MGTEVGGRRAFNLWLVVVGGEGVWPKRRKDDAWNAIRPCVGGAGVGFSPRSPAYGVGRKGGREGGMKYIFR